MNDVYCIFDTMFYVRRVGARWRWEADAYPYGNHYSSWYDMRIEPSMELFKQFVADSAGLNQT
jgi:hypothetical protein